MAEHYSRMAIVSRSPALKSRIRWHRWLLALYIISIIVVAVPKGTFDPDNNFAIFRASFGHLVAGRDLYAPSPSEYADLYKYSPTFAALFAPFAVLPLPISILVWSALNTLLLYYAVRRLLPEENGTLALALLYFGILGNMQRAQSNSLVAALVILAFLAFERRRQVGAALALAIAALVKIFPLAALPLALFHPRRIRFALIFAGVMLTLVALPLLVTSPHQLVAQYRSWQHQLAIDAHATAGFTGGSLYGGVMEQFRMWFGVHWPNWPVQLAGTVVLLLPIAVRRREWGDRTFRLRVLSSLLIYMVIFNHMSESPSFVIALAGIVIWYVTTPRTAFSTALMALTIAVVSLSSTEITPHHIQHVVFVRYHLKTVPCFLVWLVIQAELLGLRPRSGQRAEVHELDVATPEPSAQGG
jgi:hypothetical protein